MKDEKDYTSILQDAFQKGYDYLARWRACAPTVFAAVMDAIGYENDDLATEVWKATVGLTGGTGNMAIGTCGALAGAAAAISLSFGYTKHDIEKDVVKMLKLNAAVAELGEKMMQKYRGISCQDVQFHHWGKAYRFTNQNALLEFVSMSPGKPATPECQQVTGDLAKWTVENIIEHNPEFINLKK